MHIGKIPEIAYRRSVLKKISNKTEGIKAGVEGAPVILEDVTLVMSSNCILKWFQNCEDYYIQKTLNGIYEQDAVPKYVQLEINIPVDFDERELGKIITRFDIAIQKRNMAICQCRVYNSSIKHLMANITILGYSKRILHKSNIKAGMHVVMAGTTAIGATYIMSSLYEDKLLNKFSKSFVEDCIKMKDYLDVRDMSRIAIDNDAVYVKTISDGGIFAALWELVSSENLGIEADVKNIPVWQEAVEIAEVFDYNPYLTDGTGAILIVTHTPDKVIERLHDEGYYAKNIATVTKGRDRVIINGDEKRYLEPPKGDELYKFL